MFYHYLMNELEFINHLKRYLPEEEINALLSAQENNLVTSSLLLDVDKCSKETLLNEYPFLVEHPQVENVFLYNKEEHQMGKTLLFEMGGYYIFEPCSSLVNYFLQPNENDFVLDMASAPGGKSIHCSFLMHNKGQIISNEISYSRAQILSSNVEKYGRKNISVISNECGTLAKEFPETFTKIILDAPCSGSGMFRKENKMKDDWTFNKVLSLTPIQKELILQAYRMLSPGGEMIYSTCSFSMEEDEDIVSYLLENTDAELVNLPSIQGEYRSSMKECIHLFPHLYEGEGHFIAKIKKPGTLKPTVFKYKNPAIKDVSKEIMSLGDIYLSNQKELYVTNHLVINRQLHYLRNGIKIGLLDPKLGLIYDHAFSRIDLGVLSKIEVTEQEAKDYIYGLTIQKAAENGYYILTYKGIPFALSKCVKSTFKNHYPKGLRKK